MLNIKPLDGQTGINKPSYSIIISKNGVKSYNLSDNSTTSQNIIMYQKINTETQHYFGFDANLTPLMTS